jgi:hypothetical protein
MSDPTRELKQLFAAARMSLTRATALQGEATTYEQVLAGLQEADPAARFFLLLRQSVDLDSAALRLASAERTLNPEAWKTRYRPDARFDENLHFYLRDAVAREEPGDQDRPEHRDRQKRLAALSLGQAYAAIGAVEKRLLAMLATRGDLARWASNVDPRKGGSMTGWVLQMTEEGGR